MSIAPAVRPRDAARYVDRPSEKNGNTLTFGGVGAAADAYRVAYGPGAPENGAVHFLAYAIKELGRTPQPGDSVPIPPESSLGARAVDAKVFATAQRLVKDGITLTVNAKRRQKLKETEKTRNAPVNAGPQLGAAPLPKKPAKAIQGYDVASRAHAAHHAPGKHTAESFKAALTDHIATTRGEPAPVRLARLESFITSELGTNDLRQILSAYPNGRALENDLQKLFDENAIDARGHSIAATMMHRFAETAVGFEVAERIASAVETGSAPLRAISKDAALASALASDLRLAQTADAKAMAAQLGLSEQLVDNLRKAPNDELAGKVLQTEAGRTVRELEQFAAKVRNRSGDLQLYKLAPAITEQVLKREGTLAQGGGHASHSITNAAQEAIHDDIAHFDRGKEPYIVAGMAVGTLVALTVFTGGIGSFAAESAFAVAAESPMLAVGHAESEDFRKLASVKLAPPDAARAKLTEATVAALVSVGIGLGAGKLLTQLAKNTLVHAAHTAAEALVTANVGAVAAVTAMHVGEHMSEDKLALTPAVMRQRLAFQVTLQKLASAESQLVAVWMQHAPGTMRTAESARRAVLTYGTLYAEQLMTMSEGQIAEQFAALAKEPTRYAMH